MPIVGRRNVAFKRFSLTALKFLDCTENCFLPDVESDLFTVRGKEIKNSLINFNFKIYGNQKQIIRQLNSAIHNLCQLIWDDILNIDTICNNLWRTCNYYLTITPSIELRNYFWYFVAVYCNRLIAKERPFILFASSEYVVYSAGD